MDDLVYVPQMLLIGAFGRNSGKTTLACEIISQWKDVYPIYGAKIIAIDKVGAPCHRGGAGCGICTNIKGTFEIIEERGGNPSKDTAQMIAAGAEKSFLIKSLKSNMLEAFSDFLAQVPKGTIIIVESNTLRKYVVPGVFVFAGENVKLSAMKKSAQDVYGEADLIINPKRGNVISSLKIRELINGDITVEANVPDSNAM